MLVLLYQHNKFLYSLQVAQTLWSVFSPNTLKTLLHSVVIFWHHESRMIQDRAMKFVVARSLAKEK